MKTSRSIIVTASTLFAIFLLTVITFHLNAQDKQKWVKFSDDTEQVSIKFPVQPQLIDETREDGGHHIRAHVEMDPSIVYMLDVVHHVTPLDDPGALNQTSLDAFLNQIEHTSYTQEDIKIKGNPGIEAIIEMQNAQARIAYCVIIVGQRQVQATVIMPYEVWNEDDVDEFLSSLKVK